MLALMEAPSRRFQIPSRRGELDVAAAFRQFLPTMAGDVVGTVVLEIEQRSVRLLCQFVLEPRDLAVALDDPLLQQPEYAANTGGSGFVMPVT